MGGTHPALVEAMGYGNCCLVHDAPENRETAGDAAVYFDAADPASLRGAIAELEARPGRIEELRRAAAERAGARFSWEQVADRYAEILERIAR